jgi:hypothetical protein
MDAEFLYTFAMILVKVTKVCRNICGCFWYTLYMSVPRAFVGVIYRKIGCMYNFFLKSWLSCERSGTNNGTSSVLK